MVAEASNVQHLAARPRLVVENNRRGREKKMPLVLVRDSLLSSSGSWLCVAHERVGRLFSIATAR